MTQNQHTHKTKARFSRLLRCPALKWSGAILVEWKSKKIDRASKKEKKGNVKDTKK